MHAARSSGMGRKYLPPGARATSNKVNAGGGGVSLLLGSQLDRGSADPGIALPTTGGAALHPTSQTTLTSHPLPCFAGSPCGLGRKICIVALHLPAFVSPSWKLSFACEKSGLSEAFVVVCSIPGAVSLARGFVSKECIPDDEGGQGATRVEGVTGSPARTPKGEEHGKAWPAPDVSSR